MSTRLQIYYCLLVARNRPVAAVLPGTHLIRRLLLWATAGSVHVVDCLVVLVSHDVVGAFNHNSNL